MKTQNLPLRERIAVRSFQIIAALLFGFASVLTTVIFSPVIVCQFLARHWSSVWSIVVVVLIFALTIAAMIVLPILKMQP